MSFDSFYGGRQGASFVIVERFDVVDSSTSATKYAGRYLAIVSETLSNTGEYIYLYNSTDGFIERDYTNFDKYTWAFTILDGRNVSTKESAEASSITVVPLPTKNADGMRQCFEQGGDTTDRVNYGEYVIIDSPNKNDSDNGKVFRRGMNFDYNATSNPYAGGEYIGQICGPAGPASEIGLTTESDVQSYTGYNSGSYDVANSALVPGYDGNVFRDNISYSWVTIRDIYGNVQGALIGFTIPYLIEEFTANPVSAYYHRDEEGIPIENTELIERVDDGAHPFYQKWKILVPEGLKGESSTNIEKIDTQVKAGTTYYHDQQFSSPAGTLASLYDLDTDNVDYTLSYIPIEVNEEIYYIKNDGETTCTSILRYTETTYDRKAEGETTFVPIGAYNIIKSIWIESNGDVYIDYSYDNVKKLDDVHLRWVDNMVIQQDGHYIVTYNDATTDEGDIHFIDKINVDNDGTITYFYSDGSQAGEQTHCIRWITDVQIDDRDGNGTQQIIITYNNDKNGTTSISEAIGSPINYILEAVISESRAESSTTAPFHLLVLYSDPITRANIVSKGQNAVYRSSYPDDAGNYLRNDWHDLGNVRGAKGGLGIIGKLANDSLLKDDSSNPVSIPPEYMNYAIAERAAGRSYIYNPPQGLDSQYAGWLITIDASTSADPYAVDLYFYDYASQEWVRTDGLSGGGAAPAQVIAISDINIVPTNPDLEEDGIWFVTEERKMAN